MERIESVPVNNTKSTAKESSKQQQQQQQCENYSV
jgi:hypothetical protein